MSSSVFYRFKSQKDFTRLSFDSPLGISVFDLKRDIITREKLGNGQDFDLRISNADSNQEYSDDAETVQKGTSIIVQRKPPSRGPGKGSAARYVTGNPIHIQARQEFSKQQPAPIAASKPAADTPSGTSEEDAIKRMFQATDSNWADAQDKMAMSKPIFRPGAKVTTGPVPDRPPPAGYLCYRCGQKGHWIQACPTNGDETFDNRVRIKRTTGIPRSQLQKIENIDGVDPANVMINAEGESVMFVPDSKSWESYKEIQEHNKDEELPADHELACAICHKLLKAPHKTPCCSKLCCEDCITGALLESDFVCPLCGTSDVLLDKLVPDEEAADKVKAYKADKAAEGASPAEESTAGQKRPLEDESEAKPATTDLSSFPQFQIPGMPPMPMLPGMPPMPMPMPMPMMPGLPMMPGMPPMPMMPGMPPMDPVMFAQMMGIAMPPEMMQMMQQQNGSGDSRNKRQRQN